MYTPEDIQAYLEKILPVVQKPGRYTGGELNQVIKNWDQIQIRVALLFPDIYEIGMSNLGLAILYDLINHRQDALAERAYSPWVDMEELLRKYELPLFSLETKHPLSDFDIIGFSLPYETIFTNTLNALDLAKIPLFSHERNEHHPLIIAGGHATFNPEPMFPYIDAFVIGEGEEVIHEIIDVYKTWKYKNAIREKLLINLSTLWGVYVPSLYQDHYLPDGKFSHIAKRIQETPLPIIKRIVPKLPPPITNFIVPYIDTVHNRIPIEITRGCTRGCRFCQAGMITRPVRERKVEEILCAIEQAYKSTGYEEVSLLSLSSSDYSDILPLVTRIDELFSGYNLSISLPSLRIESFSVEIMEALKRSRRGGFTLAPEAATERMRNIINKPVSTAQLIETAQAIYSRGWPTIKLYFMIGHPSESMEDVTAIADLCKAVLHKGYKSLGKRAQVHASVSIFIPKPHTPFQWSPFESIEQIYLKQNLLKKEIRGKGLKLSWNQPEGSMLESWLSRGDRRMAQVIYEAWRKGAKFDAWNEHFHYDVWLEAFKVSGLDPTFYTYRQRKYDENFPWDHISASIKKQFLLEDYYCSQRGQTRTDCRNQCFSCGILPTFTKLRQSNPGDVWQCPDIQMKKTIARVDVSPNG